MLRYYRPSIYEGLKGSVPIKKSFKNPLNEYNKILDFLDLPSHYPDIKGKRGISPDGLYDNIIIEPKIIKFLNNYFLSWNEKLFNLIKVKYDWTK